MPYDQRDYIIDISRKNVLTSAPPAVIIFPTVKNVPAHSGTVHPSLSRQRVSRCISSRQSAAPVRGSSPVRFTSVFPAIVPEGSHSIGRRGQDAVAMSGVFRSRMGAVRVQDRFMMLITLCSADTGVFIARVFIYFILEVLGYQRTTAGSDQ